MRVQARAVERSGLTSRWTDSGLHYVECGTGPIVLVLLHGYTDSWRSFGRVLNGLASRCRCLAIDLRGHGESPFPGGELTLDDLAADVVEVLDRSGIDSATLVGHSMGSFVARNVALNRPDLARRLVLVGSGLRVDNPVVRELGAQVARLRSPIPRGFVDDFQSSCVFDRASLPESFFDECVSASMGVEPEVWRAVLAAMLAHDDRDRLSRIAQPTLVLGGCQDAIFHISEQARLADALPGGRLLAYERCGHSPHWEEPARFCEDVLRFCGEPH